MPWFIESGTERELGTATLTSMPTVASMSPADEADAGIGPVEHEVPALGREAEDVERVDLLAHAPRARHVGAADEHDVGRGLHARRACARRDRHRCRAPRTGTPAASSVSTPHDVLGRDLVGVGRRDAARRARTPRSGAGSGTPSTS